MLTFLIQINIYWHSFQEYVCIKCCVWEMNHICVFVGLLRCHIATDKLHPTSSSQSLICSYDKGKWPNRTGETLVVWFNLGFDLPWKVSIHQIDSHLPLDLSKIEPKTGRKRRNYDCVVLFFVQWLTRNCRLHRANMLLRLGDIKQYLFN